jgi:hypothetical protein
LLLQLRLRLRLLRRLLLRLRSGQWPPGAPSRSRRTTAA